MKPARRSFPRVDSRPLLVVLLVFLLVSSARGQQQLTFAQRGDSTAASITANGRRVAFRSFAQLAASGSPGSDAFVVERDGSGLTRLTGDQLTVRAPVIAANGAMVIFVSSSNPTGDNPDTGTELFAVDPDGTGLTQITDTGASGIRAPSPSSNGSRIAFTATGDLLQDGSNDDGSREVFVIDADGDNLVQITHGPAGTSSRVPDISGNSNRVVFSSNADLTGGNTDGSREIFVADSDGSGAPEQLTDAIGGQSRRPSIADDGLIAFESSASLDGGNTDGNFEIFVVDAHGGPPRRITSASAGDSTHPVIAASGFRIAFQSSANLTGANPDGSFEIFIARRDGTDIDQLTDSQGPSTRPDISASGERVVFQSSANLTGNNPELNTEIYVLDPVAAVDDQPDDEGDSLFCSEGSGCVLCFEDDGSDTAAAEDRVFDPTFALLVLLAGIRIARRPRRRN